LVFLPVAHCFAHAVGAPYWEEGDLDMMQIDDPELAIADLNRRRSQKRIMVLAAFAAIVVGTFALLGAVYSDDDVSVQETTLPK
jgi:hypothetical protein